MSQDLMASFGCNPLLWGHYTFPERFRLDTPPFHVKIVTESQKEKFLAVAAPRESAKSELLGFLTPAHDIAFRKEAFVTIVQNTYAKAARALENLKKDFRDNPKLKIYGIKIVKDSEGDSIFRHKDGFETRILCKGAEQMGSVRGERFGPWRITKIIVDDLEDDELVRSVERRRNLQDAFDEALLPALDKELGKVVVIGTILHDDSLMHKLVSPEYYREFRKLLFKARGDNGRSLWPAKWSEGYLQELEESKPHVFAKEYQNDPSSGRAGSFERRDFRYWAIENDEYLLFDDENRITSRGSFAQCKAAIGCDLAWEEKRESDSSVLLPVLMTPKSEILVDFYIHKKGMRPSEFEEGIFAMEERLKALTGYSVPIGFEKAKLEKVMKFLMKEAMRRRNRFLWFKDVLWDGDKVSRIMTRLQSRYAQHVMYHRRGMGDLEEQLLRFPTGAHDDVIDALQGAVSILDYPRIVPKEVKKDNAFAWWQKQTRVYRERIKEKYIFGIKSRPSPIKSTPGCPLIK